MAQFKNEALCHFKFRIYHKFYNPTEDDINRTQKMEDL